VLDRLAAAQPRIVAAIDTIVRAIPDDYAGVKLIPAEAVAEVMGRTIVASSARLEDHT
jgi:5'-methylthioadenosine phosphorylase